MYLEVEMENNERPFQLMLLIMFYFLFGFSAVLGLIRGGESDVFSLSLIVIAIGLLMKKVWAFLGLKVVVTLQVLALALSLLFLLFSGNGTAFIGLGSFKLSISPLLFNVLFTIYVGWQVYVAFSKETKHYLVGT